jgi:hypothetical protein
MLAHVRRWSIREIALGRGALIVGLAFVLYAWLAPSRVVDADNAEFSLLGALGGVAHPPGFPAYVLWLRALSWLPFGSAAHVANLATAVLAAAQLAVLHAAARAWGARGGAATAAVLIFAGAPIVIAMSSEAEVFALNGLVVALVVWLAAAAGPVRGRWRCALLGLVAGIGLANQTTCALVAPLGIYGVVRGAREASAAPASRARVATAIACALLGLCVGLTPYLYLFCAPEHAGTWGHITSAHDVLDTILRREFGGLGSFAPQGIDVPLATSLAALARTLGRTLLWLPALAGLVVLGLRCVRAREGGEPRGAWIALAASFVLAGPWLASRFNVPPEGVGTYIIERFHIQPALLLVIPVAGAFELVARRLPRVWAAPVLAAFAFVSVVTLALPRVRAIHVPAVEAAAENLVRSLPPNAVMIGSADDLIFSIHYVQLVLHERPDVTYISWPLMTLPWYRARIGMPLEGPAKPSLVLATAVMSSGRPLFVDAQQANILASFPSYPYGLAIRVLHSGTAPPPLADVVEQNKQLFAAFHFGYPPPGPDDEWPTEVHRRYAATWQVLADRLARSGRADEADAALEMAHELSP